MVHLATHGQFSSKAEDTFLLAWDGRINVNDLERLLRGQGESSTLRDREPIELLVLSACQTAKGDNRAALGLAGVAVRSGARSTLATLWSVQDKSTAQLMAEFYRLLTQPGVTKAEALRYSQLSLLNSPQYKHPYYWSPSVLETRSANLPERIIFQDNFDPPGDGEPKDSSGAGSRDALKCSQDEQPIQPLMPKRNYGLTLEEHPPVFVYLPKTSARQVVLTFQDEIGESYERAFLPLTDRTGIASFTLPDEKPPLVLGKNYQWSLVIVCGETVQPDDPVFRGWVQRVGRTSELERELGQKSVIEQAGLYGAKGYWYDMIQVMAQVRRSHPDDPRLTALWRDLLESVGLGAIAP